MISKSSKILIVDDSKLIRTMVKSYLIALGYDNFSEAQDGQEALVKYEEEKPAFIFMDIVMPNMTGNEALEIIRKKDKTTPISMLTSVDKNSVIEQCQEIGITGYILKPLSKEQGPNILMSHLNKA